ncbi:hypothetical protein Droror1_Dr00026436 [Drosera rotundifolia]
MATTHKLYVGCTGLVLIMIAMAAPIADAGLFTFTDNPLFYCRDCLANGDKASSLSWTACCPGLSYAGQRFSAAGTKTIDKVFGCLCYKGYMSELAGYSYNNTQNTLKRCKASFPWAFSASVDCFKAFNFYS